MDKTDQYIKMMTHAEEILLLGPNIDDFTRQSISISSMGNCFYIIPVNLHINTLGYKSIWLPRQDQLQEMVTDKGYFRFSLIELFYRFCMNTLNILRFTSMEQLWLAFVMKTKYNKIWDGEDWIVD